MSSESKTYKQLFIAKQFYFWYYAAGVFLIPYYNLFFKRIGLTGSQIGIAAALRPWTSAPMSSAWGALADRFCIHRAVLVLTFVMSTITRCCMAVPAVYSSFGSLLAVVLLTEALQGPPNMLADTATMATVRSDHDYGLQRLWGTVGWGLFSSFAGWVVGHFGVRSAFVGYAIGSVICLIPTTFIDFGPLYTKRNAKASPDEISTIAPLITGDEPAVASASDQHIQLNNGLDHSTSPEQHSPLAAIVLIEEDSVAPATLSSVLGLLNTWAFFLLSVVMGFGIGTIEGFLFIFLDDLGAPTTLMGTALAVTCMAEAPVFWLTTYLYKMISVTTALQLVLLAYIVRMSVYVSLPLWPVDYLWFVLPVELLHGITFGVGWSAGTIQAARLAPNHMRATMQGIFQALFSGLGYGTGGLIGGIMYHQYGGQKVFATGIAVITAGWFLYVLLTTAHRLLLACRRAACE